MSQHYFNRLHSWLRRNLLFVLLVLVPVSVATIYFTFIASDVYVSESRFLVRSPQHPVQSGLFGELLQGSGLGRSQDDTYSVHDFIMSRDALKQLDDQLHIRQAYSADSADILGRFPGYRLDASFESLYRYYGKHVDIQNDPVSSISILTVRAFTADDAYRINNKLLDMSEQLVNTLNERSHFDLIHFAEEEVRVASVKSEEASLALFNYRSKHAVFEPDKQAALELESSAKIHEELVATETEISQLKQISPDNPQLSALSGRAEALRSAIATEASRVTSSKGSLSADAPTFERLALESAFADKQLGVAFSELETARAEAARKELYLERLVQPHLADKAMEPHRIRSVFTILLFSLIVWGLASLLIASIREHSG
jgi:capsular polysaccharide transport system permease protein